METNEFDSWLSNKLISLNPDTDTDIFVQYIRSILDSDEEDIPETLKGLLQEISVIFLLSLSISNWEVIIKYLLYFIFT